MAEPILTDLPTLPLVTQAHGVEVVDLATLLDAHQVPREVANALLGLVMGEDPLPTRWDDWAVLTHAVEVVILRAVVPGSGG